TERRATRPASTSFRRAPRVVALEVIGSILTEVLGVLGCWVLRVLVLRVLVLQVLVLQVLVLQVLVQRCC
ncbi:MAG TPA: hypothetical protein VKH34_12500, partial [Vicinamibacterales bacterium]|nr:hypothetical protein [Vicinamibacterales bacterium]